MHQLLVCTSPPREKESLLELAAAFPKTGPYSIYSQKVGEENRLSLQRQILTTGTLPPQGSSLPFSINDPTVCTVSFLNRYCGSGGCYATREPHYKESA
jgi:hypothetical protein